MKRKWQDQNNARNIHLEDEKKNEAGRSFFQSLWKGISCWLLFHFIQLNLLFCVYYNGRICITSTQCSRLFFSTFFESASSIPIGNCILCSNHSIKLLVLIGFLRNLQECDLNLPDISCSGSPLLCLCVKIFCFVVFVNIWTETHLLPSKILMLLLWISTLYFWSIFFHAHRAPINRFY